MSCTFRPSLRASRLVIGYWCAGYEELSRRAIRSALRASFMW